MEPIAIPTGMAKPVSLDHSEQVNEFFRLSNTYKKYETDEKVCRVLQNLLADGYRISQKHVVFGKEGQSWPLLKSTKGGSVLCGLAIGTRGSSGFGAISLKEYLNQVCHEALSLDSPSHLSHPKVIGAVSDPLAEALDSALHLSYPTVVDAPASDSLAAASVPSSSYARMTEDRDYPPPATVKPGAKISIKNVCSLASKFGSEGFTFMIGSCLSLDDLRTMYGIFQGPPPEAVNTLTSEQVMNATFTIYQNGAYSIHQESTILACTPGLHILPTMFGLFEHGPGKYSDDPCKNPYSLKFPLNNKEMIDALLPYLNGIPPYNQDE